MAYEHDFFLSYRREPPVGKWVHTHFAPLLRQWLNESCDRPVEVFVDVDEITPGSEWPMRLRHALARSRFLVPVFSPSYFRSRWCLAELATMQARERALGLRTEADPRELIFPVNFHDGKHFAPSVKTIETVDLRSWNQPSEAFAQTPDYVALTRAVQKFAARLADLVEVAPAWDPGWPEEMPDTPTSYDIELPRLGEPPDPEEPPDE